MYHHRTPQRGASLVETSLSIALVGLMTVAAIRGYGNRMYAVVGRDLVGALGGSSRPAIVNNNDPRLSFDPVVTFDPAFGPAQPPLIDEGSSPVGGGPNIETSRIR